MAGPDLTPPHLVLPPIDTTGMTTADIPELAIRTREAMVQALQEISQPYNGPKTFASKINKDATLMPPPPPPSTGSKSGGITEIRPAGQETDSSRQRTPSLVRSIASSEENGSQETEEEDGHVLVRRPA
jgi:lysophosphatidate acyltransferase